MRETASQTLTRRAALSIRAVFGLHRQWTDFRRSITGIVVIIIAAMTVPLIIVMLLALQSVVEANQKGHRNSLLYTARAIAVGVDAELDTYRALANALAVSDPLLSDDLAKFDALARRAIASYPNAWVVVTNLDGQQLVNTGVAPGVPLGHRSVGGLAAQARTIASGQLEVSDVTLGAARQLWTVTVELASFKNGTPHRVLTIATTLDGFGALLARQTLPPGWLVGIIDRQGNFVARVPRKPDATGQPASLGFREKRGQEGVWEYPSLEGDVIVSANAVSPKTGWTVGVAISKETLTATSRRALSWAGPLTLVIAAIGLAVATLLMRRIAGNLADFRNRTGALLQNGHAEFNSHLPELTQCWDDLSTAVKARRDAETALRESEATFRAMFSVSSVGMVQANPQTGRFLRANTAMCEMTGYSEQELRALTVFDITHADDRDRDRDGIRCLVAGETPVFDVEKRYVRKDGSLIWGRATVNVIRDDHGQALRNTAIIQDITARRQSEIALRESQDQLRVAVAAAKLGQWSLDLRTSEMTCSGGCKANFGRRPDDRFTYDDLWATIHPDHRDRVGAAVKRAVEDRTDYDTEYQTVWPDGTLHWVIVRGLTQYAPDGTPLVMTGVTLDITERKRNEDQIILLMREVAHRSKNILSLVQSIARLTAKYAHGDFAIRFSERIQALAASQDVIVTGNWHEVSLHDLVRSQLLHFKDLIGSRIVLEGDAITISPAAAQTIGMALFELATNASKYGALSDGNGRIVIAWRLTQTDAGERFEINWIERGGPPVVAPQRRGFGSTVIETMAKGGLAASVHLDYPPAGLEWHLTCPADGVKNSA